MHPREWPRPEADDPADDAEACEYETHRADVALLAMMLLERGCSSGDREIEDRAWDLLGSCFRAFGCALLPALIEWLKESGAEPRAIARAEQRLVALALEKLW